MSGETKKLTGIIDRIIAEAVATAGADTATTVEVRVGPYWSAVRTSRGTGLASTMAHDHAPGRAPIAGAGSLHGMAPAELAALLRSESAPEAAVGLAAVNALLDPVARTGVEGNAVELLCERAAGRLLAVVGHFPFMDRLRACCREVWVFERSGSLRPGDLGEASLAELLPHAEVVAVTGTTVINHSVEEIAARIRQDAFAIMLGPSTPMASCLFELGFDVLCGTVVEDPEAVLRAASEGAVTGQIGGVRRVCRFAAGARDHSAGRLEHHQGQSSAQS
jgi:uncharacterized protein (DUF4213/DUF364 family)